MAHRVPALSDEFVSSATLERVENVVSKMEPRTQRGFFGVKEQTRQSSAAVETLNTRIKTTSKEVEWCQQDSARHRAEILARTGRPATDAEMQPKIEALERERGSLSALQAEGSRATSAATNDRTLFAGLVKTLLKLSAKGTKVRLKDVKLRPGRWDEQLTETVAKRADVQAEIRNIGEAERPLSELRSDLIRQMDEIAARSDPFRVEGNRWVPPEKTVEGAKHQLPGRPVTTDDAVSIILNLFGEEVRKRVLERFDAVHRESDTLRIPEDQKRAKLGALRGELLELDYRESALRIAQAGDSLEISFPTDLHPLAVLGVEVLPN
jgi:chromosome segregation ATPase